jgi:hypothetical protein
VVSSESWTDRPSTLRISVITAIRVIFDGKAFIPQEPVSLPNQSEAMVIVEENDPTAQGRLDAAVREYYRGGGDADDVAWRDATAPDAHKAWDED